jgi:hypothetical protein
VARTVRCSEATRAGRLAKAQQFWAAAHTIETFADDEDSISDAYTTLAVHAGIAAADVICCVRLGWHARGDDPDEAVALLAGADPDRAKHLETLLRMKTDPPRARTAGERIPQPRRPASPRTFRCEITESCLRKWLNTNWGLDGTTNSPAAVMPTEARNGRRVIAASVPAPLPARPTWCVFILPSFVRRSARPLESRRFELSGAPDAPLSYPRARSLSEREGAAPRHRAEGGVDHRLHDRSDIRQGGDHPEGGVDHRLHDRSDSRQGGDPRNGTGLIGGGGDAGRAEGGDDDADAEHDALHGELLCVVSGLGLR